MPESPEDPPTSPPRLQFSRALLVEDVPDDQERATGCLHILRGLTPDTGDDSTQAHLDDALEALETALTRRAVRGHG